MSRTAVEIETKVLTIITESENGLRTDEVAALLSIPVRTARRHLATLHERGKLGRISEYEGSPPVFHFRYVRKRA